MATLQKFKLLATQCATAARSPSRSPAPAAAAAAASPAFRLRRRKTLRRLLGRSCGRTLLAPAKPAAAGETEDPGEKKGLLSHTLRDLFVSSPPAVGGEVGGEGGRVSGGDGGGRGGVARRFGFGGLAVGRFAGRLRGGGSGGGLRSGSGGLRYRLLRRAWRPVLVTIPE
ncbi:uncharacterized protein LOC103712776 [Phoenix dactylifera]|uniref:Uncharacterized protein LOC103712776 n=1 Tax=Phoenix dactylifera TaxID=42345 RepID=A0A8B7CEM1_PHODC|nr:uncharacterized protein LOC103712776 [Phoenix dactylifera]